MRPRLLPDTHLLPSDQGIVIRGPRHTAAFPVPGMYAWLERIRPFLDGSRSIDQLVAELPPAAAQHVRTLVQLLAREGFVRDAEGDLPHGLSPEIRVRHSALIDFIALRADSPEHRFELYRNCAPVVFGSGRMGSAVILALLASGVERVRLVPLDSRERTVIQPDLTRLDECVELLRREGGVFRYEAIPGTDCSLPADAGLAVVASDEFDPEISTRIRAAAARSGLAYAQAVVRGRRVHLSTLRDLDMASYGDPVPGPEDGPEGPEHDGRYLGGPVAALAANQLCLQLLHRTAGLGEQGSGGTAAPEEAVLDLATARFLTARPA
ncbi:hypothetical protein GXW82_15380 [Streptacidiphilus sp. 4-A2]|nr:hypothetical protein [Streptacidiphilus sp. 4-A2]